MVTFMHDRVLISLTMSEKKSLVSSLPKKGPRISSSLILNFLCSFFHFGNVSMVSSSQDLKRYGQKFENLKTISVSTIRGESPHSVVTIMTHLPKITELWSFKSRICINNDFFLSIDSFGIVFMYDALLVIEITNL